MKDKNMQKNQEEQKVYSVQPENNIYLFRESRYFGPFSESQVKEFLGEGLLRLDHYYWKNGMKEWEELNDYEFFKSSAAEKPLEVSDEFFAKHTNAEASVEDINDKPESSDGQRLDDIIDTLEKDYFAEFKLEGFDEEEKQKQEPVQFKIDKKAIVIPVNEMTKRAALMVVGTVAFVALVSSAFKSPVVDTSLINKLDNGLRKPMMRLVNMRESVNKPQFRAEPVSTAMKEPEFIMATNAMEGTKLRIVIEGIAQTLVAKQNFRFDEDHVVTNKVFSTGKLRQIDGRYVSQGEYRINVTCETCQKLDNKLVYSASFFVGGRRDQNYEERLKIHHFALRKKANEEIDELSMIIKTLKEQLDLNITKYIRYKDQSSDLAYSRWKDFNVSWVKTQGAIVEAFKEMDNEYFVNDLIYSELYQKLRVTSIQLMELQNIHDKIVMNKRTWADKRPAALRDSKSIQATVKDIQRNLNKFKKGLSSTNGYPFSSKKAGSNS